MSTSQLYQLLKQEKLHYQALALDVNVIRRWSEMGYPVIISGAETGMYDNPIEESNPSTGAGSQQVFNWTTLEWTPTQ